MMKDRIRKLRLARGMTLQQVATHFGITSASVSSWEKGINQPDSRKLAVLAEVLGTSVGYLLEGTERLDSVAYWSGADAGPLVPFRPWEQLSDPESDLTAPAQVTPLHTRPGPRAFATRYPGGATGLDWRPGPLPAGALVFVEPALAPQPGDLALLLDRTGRPFIGTPVAGTSPEGVGPRFRDYASGKAHGGSVLLGRIVEWQLSSSI